ncbi:hypothetical protein FDK38_000507 [Candidozyma auris]|nr:hypothetical protein FDK38_000507 [[Candida] auris]
MRPLFYEKNSQIAVSVAETDGVWSLSTSKTISPEQGYVAVSKNDSLIANREVYVVDSIKAGKGQGNSDDSIYARILKPIFEDLIHIEHHYVATTSAESIAEFASSLPSSPQPKLVIILGGDTSISEFVNGIGGSFNSGLIDLAVIPTGTGNALALSLGIGDVHSALRRLFTSTLSKPLNVYSALLPEGTQKVFRGEFVGNAPKKYYFLVVLSWAFHASLVADSDTEELRQYGNERFKIAAGQNLSRPQKYEGAVLLKSKEKVVKTNGPFSYLIVTPVQEFEPGFRISPRGNVFDSSLYVLTVGYEHEESISGKYLFDVMMEAYDNGKHIDNPRVSYQEVTLDQNIILEGENLLPAYTRRFCVDGAIVSLPENEKATIQIQPEGSQLGDWKLRVLT